MNEEKNKAGAPEPTRVGFLKRNWLALVGVLVGITGLVVGIQGRLAARTARQPVLLEQPARSLIVDSKRLSRAPLYVARSDGSAIAGDVSTLLFYFWNNGKAPIHPEDVLEPIEATIMDPAAEILDVEVVKSSRDVVNPRLLLDSARQRIALDFKILEKNDGFACQIIYKGDPKAPLRVSGTIEGVDRILTAKDFTRAGQPPTALASKLLMGLMFMIFVAISWEILQRKVLLRHRPRLRMSVNIVTMILFYTLAAWVVAEIWLQRGSLTSYRSTVQPPASLLKE